VQPGVTKSKRCVRAARIRQACLDALEAQDLEIGGAPDVGWRAADVVDAVALAPLEIGELATHVAAKIPVESRLPAPGAFRTQIGRAEIRRVVIVEVGEGRHAEGAAQARTQLQPGGEPYSGAAVGLTS
jgi:hypothetical protein